MFLRLWWQKAWNTLCQDMFHGKILGQNLRHNSFGIPRSASSSLAVSGQSLLIAAHTCSTFSGVLLVAGLPECGLFSTGSCPSLKCLCHIFICTALIVSSTKDFWIIRIISTEECSSLMQNLMQICCSTRSVILNAMATQYTCSHCQVQWSHHSSHMHIPVRCPWLPGYMDVTKTIHDILTMAGLFPDRTQMLYK